MSEIICEFVKESFSAPALRALAGRGKMGSIRALRAAGSEVNA